MITQEHSKLLENIWLPNGPETVMVSLSCHRLPRPHHTALHATKRQEGRLSGGRIPPFFERWYTVLAQNVSEEAPSLTLQVRIAGAIDLEREPQHC